MTFKEIAFRAKGATVLRSSTRTYQNGLAIESLPNVRLDELQNDRAIRHARFAMENSPFYREKYSSAGFTLKDLEDPAAFAKLPIIEKAEIREFSAQFRTTEATDRNSRLAGTGGSTSEPLKLLHDRRFPARVLEWRLLNWWGVAPSDDMAIVYRQFWSARRAKIHSLQWWPTKRFQLDTARLDDQNVDQFISRWQKIRPASLVGYVGGIVELTRILESRGVRLSPPKAIAVTAAPLALAQRREIEAVFQAPVYDHYRCGEVPWMAGECTERTGLHVFSDVRKIEIVDPFDKPVDTGDTGEVVVTDLTNRVFPLVRYRLGDRTSEIAGQCGCGRTLPRIAHVSGRITEAARLPNGQVIAGDFFTEIFDAAPDAVRQFQVHQLEDYSITLRCIPTDHPDAIHQIEEVAQDLRRVVNGAVPVQLELVKEIPHDAGKIRYVKSDVA